MYTNIDYVKGLQAFKQVIFPWQLFASIIDLFDLPLKSNDLMFPGHWNSQELGISTGRY